MATLNFENYFFEKFSFEENKNFDGESKNLDVDFFPKAEVNILEDENIAIVELNSIIGDESKKDCPFIGQVTLTGIFNISFDEEDHEDADLAENFLTQNTIAILFPYLRSFIADMTLRTNKFPTFILPPFNVVEMIKDNEAVTVNRLKSSHKSG
ncbi:protein-export chaperone SecB [Lactococcus petauri]|uniref:protein-export chaperone SecB n=1 Tax=Lactococcus petauri TaxID=1940789 RepID=UPI00255030CC|nr:protein-export chaperone SecB [Lactococcus petauri]